MHQKPNGLFRNLDLTEKKVVADEYERVLRDMFEKVFDVTESFLELEKSLDRLLYGQISRARPR